MKRYNYLTFCLAGMILAFLLAVVSPVTAAPDVGIEGRLNEECEIDEEIRPDCYYFPYLVYMEEGWTSIFELTSDEFDGYLILLDLDGNVLTQDDDSGGAPHARIAFSPAEDGWYELRVTTSLPKTMGKYVIVERGVLTN